MVTSNPILFTIICVFGLQAIVLSGLILRKRPKRQANIFLALMVFFYALIGLNIVLVNVLKDFDLIFVFRYIQMEMLFGIGPSIFFYTKCISQPKFKFQNKHLVHFLPLLIEFIFYRTSIYRIGSDGLYLEEMPTYSYIYFTQQWLGVFSIWLYSILSIIVLSKYHKRLKSYYSKIENLSLKWLQTPIIIYVSYHFLWRLITEIDRFAFDKTLREYYFIPNFVILAAVTCWIGFKGYIQKEQEITYYTSNTNNSEKLIIKEKDKEFLSMLQNLMETKKPFLNPDLNLTMLSEMIELKPKQLSTKINQNCEKNFYDLINSYRVEAFKERLQSENQSKMSLLGHALECGFYSKSTFNSAFKKMTQQTPSEYLKSLKKES
ncbi:MAG: AraC family transcriptional regulator [Winogradskyella sp.]|uniref:helix-turn-helix domain-containing protein n=1 Tax=Winogradskyella sp. TaxID=1883156 RepID=UPI0025CFA330|nr:helix-turn-helix domain-containing protein [Winogradskyella sp.]NRB59388.1 AraC family transcriptional regulator [Winogradskyella sp.]